MCFDAEVFCLKSSKTKGLQAMRSKGHESCLWSTNASPRLFLKGSFRIMVSIWWIIWAFVIGGYAGMLLVSLLVLARKVRPTG